jgi:hypothetical protein
MKQYTVKNKGCCRNTLKHVLLTDRQNMNINEPVFESQILFKVEAIVSGGQESDTVEESDRLAGTNRDSGVKAFTGVIGIKG